MKIKFRSMAFLVVVSILLTMADFGCVFAQSENIVLDLGQLSAAMNNNGKINIGDNWTGRMSITMDVAAEITLGTVGIDSDISKISVTNDGYRIRKINGELCIKASTDEVKSFSLSGSVTGMSEGYLRFVGDEYGDKVVSKIENGTYTADLIGGQTYIVQCGDLADGEFVSSTDKSTDLTSVSISEDTIRDITVSGSVDLAIGGEIYGINSGETLKLKSDGSEYDVSVEDNHWSALVPGGIYSFSLSSEDGYLSDLSKTSFSVTENNMSLKNVLIKHSIAADTRKEITVGQGGDYRTISEALSSIEAGGVPKSEDERVSLILNGGEVFTEAVNLSVPYVTLKTDAENPATVSWYYGTGYSYYSINPKTHEYDEDYAVAKTSRGEQTWGTAFKVLSTAHDFKAENVRFENTFNIRYTKDEISDGVYSPYDGYDRTKKESDEGYKEASSRDTQGVAVALLIDADRCEFKNCTIVSNQDTLYTGSNGDNRLYFKDCHIEGNVDYIYGGGTCVFDDCYLVSAGYTNQDGGGYITANKYGKYIFRDCTVKNSDEDGRRFGNISWGRNWGGKDNTRVYFMNTKCVSTALMPSGWNGWDPVKDTPLYVYDFSDPAVGQNEADNPHGFLSLSEAKDIYDGVENEFLDWRAEYMTEKTSGVDDNVPTLEPTNAPTLEPTNAPTAEPTNAPTAEPTNASTAKPTTKPSIKNDEKYDTLTIDATSDGGELLLGASGFLYGLGGINVPSTNLITPIKPKVSSQKTPDGLQHPNADIRRAAETYINSGGTQLQYYIQNAYGLWSYEGTRETVRDEYFPIIESTINKILGDEYLASVIDDVVCVPYNEPNNIWFSRKSNESDGTPYTQSDQEYGFLTLWKEAYDLIKSLGRENGVELKIAGPNYSSYGEEDMDAFLKYCIKNDCMPDVITWHQLSSHGNVVSNKNKYLKSLAKYDTENKYSDLPIVINEYAKQGDCSSPGKLVQWLGAFEDAKIYACLPFWHISNNLNDLAADNNEANGAWWLYKWYGDMKGNSLSVTSSDYSNFYGIASYDEENSEVTALFGGSENNGIITFSNIGDIDGFKNSDKVHVKVEDADWTGFNGVSHGTSDVMEGTYQLENNDLKVIMPKMNSMSAYKVTVSVAKPTDDVSHRPTKAVYKKVYTAYDACVMGGAKVYNFTDLLTGDKNEYAHLSDKIVGGLKSDDDVMAFDISVPADGRYKIEFIYGNGVDSSVYNEATHHPKIAKQKVYINEKCETINLFNTLDNCMSGTYVIYADLKMGENTIKISGDSSSNIDIEDTEVIYSGMYITYDGAYGKERPKLNRVYDATDAEANEYNDIEKSPITVENTIDGYTGDGYIRGLDKSAVENGGGIRYVVDVEENGFYNISLRYASKCEGIAKIYVGNTAKTFDNFICGIDIKDTDDKFEVSQAAVFLEKGINIIDIDASSNIALDYMRLSEASSEVQNKNLITVEAESARLVGCEIRISEYASGGSYVEGIKADEKGENNYLEIEADVENGGEYALTIYQSCGEIFGTHNYNGKLTNRYACISVNGGDAMCVDFRNTYSDEMFKPQTVKVYLNAGKNTIKIYNDDSFTYMRGNVKNSVKGEKDGVIYTLANYTPNLDKFEIRPLTISETDDAQNEHLINISSSEGGFVTANKDRALDGESVELSIIPEFGVNSVKQVNVDGTAVLENIRLGGTYTYTIENINSDTDIFVEFEEKTDIAYAFKDDGKLGVTLSGNCDAMLSVAKYDENGAVLNAEVKNVSSGSEYIFGGFSEGDNVKIFAWESESTLRPITDSVELTYKAPKTVVYTFEGSAYDLISPDDTVEFVGENGLSGYGPWGLKTSKIEKSYDYISGTEKTVTINFTRALAAGRGGDNKSNVNFVPTEDGMVTVLFSGAGRTMNIKQGDDKISINGNADNSIIALTAYVKKGERVYIYGDGATRVLYGVIFDNTKQKTY